MIKLHIITPVSRPENLSKIGESIGQRITNLNVSWHCAVDGKCRATRPKFPFLETFIQGPSSFFGNSLRNMLLDLIHDGWVYFLDDDNIIHENFEKAFTSAVDKYPQSQWFCFIQVRKNGEVYLQPTDSPCVGNIDSGQVVLTRALIGNSRFPLHSYAADGELFISLTKCAKPTKIAEVAAYYNYLR